MEYQYEMNKHITDTIIFAKYGKTEEKIKGKIEAGYYSQNELSTTVAEAFYTDFKMFSISDVRSILEQNDIYARNGEFVSDIGMKANYETVLSEVLNPENIENQVKHFLSANFGEKVEKEYSENLDSQKKFAREIYYNYFNKIDQDPSFDAIKNKSIYAIYSEVKDMMTEHTKSSTAFDLGHSGAFGVPSFELTHKGEKAVFGSGVEVRHLMTDKNFVEQLKQEIENPIFENEQEYVFDRLPENKATTHIKAQRKYRL